MQNMKSDTCGRLFVYLSHNLFENIFIFPEPTKTSNELIFAWLNTIP